MRASCLAFQFGRNGQPASLSASVTLANMPSRIHPVLHWSSIIATVAMLGWGARRYFRAVRARPRFGSSLTTQANTASNLVIAASLRSAMDSSDRQ